MAEMRTSERSTSEHDWHSRDYFDWWITRDQSRDAERRQRLRAMLGHAVMADLTDRGWVDRVLSLGGGPFDLAVSAIVIHNLRQTPLIANAYSGVARMLKPGALFLDYDLFFDEIGGLAGNVQLLHETAFARVDCFWQETPRATFPPGAALCPL